MDFIAVAGLSVSVCGLCLVAILAWPRPVEDREPERPRDDVSRACDELERIVASGRDYRSDRVRVVREMDRLWSIWLDGHPHERTARSPQQARAIVETHLRTVRVHRRGGHVVGHPRRARTTRARDWRDDISP